MTFTERIHSLSKHEKALVVLFLLTLPLANPWLHGDGVGYYAYVRALLIDHNLRFEKDWLAGNPTFVMGRIDEHGRLRPNQYTPTGYVANHFAVGPSLLWAPLLFLVHVVVLIVDGLGAHIPADGYSRPYLMTMALATATYGFVGLWLAFCFTRRYCAEKWAFLATLGIWFASSLPVYMYFNPSWSHAHSAFAVALFLWYWDRTRGHRSLAQWMTLGMCSGLMLDVYYPNAILLLLPLLEALSGYRQALRSRQGGTSPVSKLLFSHLFFALAATVAFFPTLITRKIIYGNMLNFGVYGSLPWSWKAPALFSILFSSDHGLLTWTPIVGLALLGLVLLRKADRKLAGYLLVAFFAFWYLISSFPNWDGLSSFGNRFFVSLTLVFVLGLAAGLSAWADRWKRLAASAFATAMVGLLAVWNLGFIFQWGTHMIPVRGPISWREMAYNQVAVVPLRLSTTLKHYLTKRRDLMNRIEREDLKQLQHRNSSGEQPEQK